jgi:thiol-disulfide isomerase/thioredoxin
MAGLLSAFALFFVQCAQKHEGYIIKGQVEGFEDSTMLYLDNTRSGETVDSTYIVNGSFLYKGELEEPSRFFLHTKFERGKPPVYTSFWMENSEIKVKGNKENFKYAEVTGSKPEDVSKILKEKTKYFHQERDSLIKMLMKMRRKDMDTTKNNKIVTQLHKVDSLRIKQEYRFIRKHLNSYEALTQLGYKKNKMSRDTLKKYVDQLKPVFKNSSYGQTLVRFLNTEPVKVGENFIDFNAKTMKGDDFSLSDVNDKYILLNFWSSGCGPCRRANKAFAGEYENMKDSIEIVGFALDKNKESVLNAIKADGIKWKVVSNFKGINGKVPMHYRISGTPTFYVISPSGSIMGKVVGYSEKNLSEIKSIIKGKEI